jgi:demethylmenaquinone methyltransferase / 2-methoxy-6-polyprenyl-1,4-benzoquinol methylase
MELSEKSKNVQNMFDRISARYDFLNRLLSFQQDVRWRKALIGKLPKFERFTQNSASVSARENLTLIDVACGTGDVMLCAAQHRADYTIIKGFDISEGMIRNGMKRAAMQPFLGPETLHTNISFSQASAESLPVESNSAHALSISFGLRNVDNRAQALAEFYRVLKPNGQVFILEFFKSKNSLFAKIFDFYFKHILPQIGGLFSDRAAYQYLPNSVSTMPEGPEFKQHLTTAGFTNVTEICWLAGATRLFIATKPK